MGWHCNKKGRGFGDFGNSCDAENEQETSQGKFALSFREAIGLEFCHVTPCPQDSRRYAVMSNSPPPEETFDLESRTWDEFGRNAVPRNDPAALENPGDGPVRSGRCETSRREILNHTFDREAGKD